MVGSKITSNKIRANYWLVCPGKVVQMHLDSMECGVVELLLETGEAGVVLGDVVDDGHHDGQGLLAGREVDVGSGQLHEDQDLLLVADDPRLAHREDVGSYRRNGEAEGDGPLELVLHHQLWLQLQSHQLNDVLQSLLGTVQQPAEPTEEGWSVGRGHNLRRTTRQNLY